MRSRTRQEVRATGSAEHRGSTDRALESLIPAEYDALRAVARRQLAVGGVAGTLSPTGLVHEAYLKLAERTHPSWRDRGHFVALVAMAMRHVLADRARARHAPKRDGDLQRVTLDDVHLAADDEAAVVLQLNDAIDWLTSVEPRLARVVDCRLFGGLTEDETAEVLGLTVRTVQRDWAKARMLLRRVLSA